MVGKLESIDTLPDATLKDILSYALSVSDEEFCAAESTFGRKAVQTSHMLLVSKRWLRVATPLLYDCVVLRNTAHAHALQGALRGNAGGQLKRFVYRLRLDGCFGAVVDKIFSGLPGVRELFVRLPSYPKEKVNGICSGLKRLSPVRVVLDFSVQSLWKNSFEMASALCEAIDAWPHLAELELYLPQFILGRGTKDDERTRLARLGAAVSRAFTLHQVILHYPRQPFGDIVHHDLPDFIKTIGKNGSIKAIRVYFEGLIPSVVSEGLTGNPCAEVVHFLLSDVRPHALISHEDDDARREPKTLPPLPVEIYRKIIDLDLRSYLASDKLETDRPLAWHYSQRCRLMMRVSKLFYAVTQPLACSFLRIGLPSELRYFADLMVRNTRFSSVVNTVIIHASSFSEGRFYAETTVGECSSLLQALPNVKELSIPTHLACAIADAMCKRSIKRLRLVLFGVPFSLSNVLASMSNLWSLTIVGLATVGYFPGTHTPALIQDGSRELLTLSSITSVRLDGMDARSLSVVQNCEFPSVHTLVIKIQEFSGSEHDQEVLSRFPNLRWLKMSGSVYSRCFWIRDDHRALEKISLSSELLDRKELRDDRGFASRFFDGINFGKFKALKEIQLASVDQWPWQDWELRDNGWTRRAQELTQDCGIKITDASGLLWKPRIQQRMGGR